MVEAARLGQLSTVRELLDGGIATVDDRDEVKCVCVGGGGGKRGGGGIRRWADGHVLG